MTTPHEAVTEALDTEELHNECSHSYKVCRAEGVAADLATAAIEALREGARVKHQEHLRDLTIAPDQWAELFEEFEETLEFILGPPPNVKASTDEPT